MADHLTEILRSKRQRVQRDKERVPEKLVRERALARRQGATAHAFRLSLTSATENNIIAEFKRRSPSKGEIRGSADAAEVAQRYQSGGAKAISVLTEEDYFSGCLADLIAVREVVAVPILRKDFVFDRYQVYESAASGADAVLLIVAALSDQELVELLHVAEDQLDIDALVEVHNRDEMARAGRAGARLIGVNNRDLRTFEVSLETSESLAADAPAGATLVSESGLHNCQDLARLRQQGYNGFLLGEVLMRAADPELTLRTLRGCDS